MRHQAKPFAVEVRKSRRSSADAPTEIIADIPDSIAVPARFEEAEKLFRRPPPQPAAAAEAAARRRILPDLSSPPAPPQPAKAEQLGKSGMRADDAPADPSPRSPSRRRPSAEAIPPVADAPAGRKNAGSAPKKTASTPVRRATPTKPVEVRPAVVAMPPRQRDGRRVRGEFLPGERWKRRLAPLLR